MTEDCQLKKILAGTHAMIDIGAYGDNIRWLRERAEGRDLMAIVKANAYGHGAVECAREAITAGASALGVARIDEALDLRRNGIEAPVLVIGPPNAAQVSEAIRESISLTASTEQSIDAIAAAASQLKTPATVHLKIDTGLHRYGALPELATILAKRLDEEPMIELEGIYTHFSSADEEDQEPTQAQVALLHQTIDQIKSAGIDVRYIHFANSAAILTGIFNGSNMVRAGIACYGLNPSDEVPVPSDLRPVLSLRSVINRRFVLPAGESVSYNRTYIATEDQQAADIPIGYADGIERHLSNRGWFIHDGQRCPILGRICMDQTVVGVPEDAREGDNVLIFGDGAHGEMTVDEVGRLSETNTYEPVVRLAARVPRIYVRNGEVESWSKSLLGIRETLSS